MLSIFRYISTNTTIRFRGLIWIVGMLVSVWACQANSSDEGNANFKITEVFPVAAVPGTKIYIEGTQLPDSAFSIYFGKTPADTIMVELPGSLISTVVPPIKEEKNLNLRISTDNNDKYSNSFSFTVIPLPGQVPSLYWIATGIYKGNVSASGTSKVTTLFEENYVRGMEVDTLAQVIHWGTYHGHIYTSSLSNNNTKKLAEVGEGLQDFVLDKEKKWMYYSQQTSIYRLSLEDTTQKEILYEIRNHPLSLYLSAQEDKLYWCERGAADVLVGDLNAKDNEPKSIFSIDEGVQAPVALTIDEEQSKIYIADTRSFGDSYLLVGNLSKPGELEIMAKTKDGIGSNIQDIVLDKNKNYLYWISNEVATGDTQKAGDIMRMSVEGEAQPEMIFQQINHGYLIDL